MFHCVCGCVSVAASSAALEGHAPPMPAQKCVPPSAPMAPVA